MNTEFEQKLDKLTKEDLLKIVKLFRERFEVGSAYPKDSESDIVRGCNQVTYMVNKTYLNLLNASVHRYSEPEMFGPHKIGDVVDGYEILEVYNRVKYKKRKRIKTTSDVYDHRYRNEKGWMYVDDYHVEFRLDNFPQTPLKLRCGEFIDL